MNTAEMGKAKCCITSFTVGKISKYILIFFPFMSNFSVWISKPTVWKGHVDVPEGAEDNQEEVAQGMLGEGHQTQ